MAKYLQTALPMKIYKKLRILAIQREVNLTDLVRDIVTDWVDQHKEEYHGSKENGEED